MQQKVTLYRISKRFPVLSRNELIFRDFSGKKSPKEFSGWVETLLNYTANNRLTPLH